MKNKCIIFAFTFIVTFLFFSSNVKADTTYYYTISNNNFDPFSTLDNLSTMLDTINNYSSVDLSTKNYAILMQRPTTTQFYYFVLYSDSNSVPLRFASSSSLFNYPNSTKLQFSSDFTSLSSTSNFNQYVNDNYTASSNSNYCILIYSNFDVPFSFYSSAFTYTFTDNVNTYSVVASGSTYFPSMYYLNNEWYGEPYPVLTSFFTLVIDRLTYLCEELTSSYIYLSMFGVLIVYIVILLFRRLFYV